MTGEPTVAVVLLSMGNRPVELAKALETLRSQRGVKMDVVLVGNGWRPVGVPDWVRSVYLKDNVGCPGGRNFGAAVAKGEFIFFYDDDAFLDSDDTLARMVARFGPRTAVVQPHGTDPDGRPTPRRWVPRLRGSKGGKVAVFWEALSMIRRSAFEQVDGWAGNFFFGHEGVDISMQLLDAGWDIIYAPDIAACHPATAASRHDHYYRNTARNRVWVARRNLPLLLIPAYLGVWVLATIARTRSLSGLKAWFAGFADGWRQDPGARRPISWATVMTMTMLGRPPLW